MKKRRKKDSKVTEAQKLLSVDNKAAFQIAVPVRIKDVQFAEPLEYETESDKKVPFTKKRAFDFLELEAFEGERDVRQTHVQFLFDEFTAGRFIWNNVILASAWLDSIQYRINGQHTSWMRVNIPDSQDETLEATITERVYRVKTSEQLRALYSAFDRNAPRTHGHITKVLLLDSDAGRDIPGSYFSYLSSGFRLWRYPTGRGAVNSVELIEQIKKQYDELFGSVGAFFTKHFSDANFIRRAATVGAMFSTFEKGIKISAEFWEPVVTGIGLEQKDDPRYQLRKFLEGHSHTATRMKEHITAEAAFRVCVNAWNYWRSDAKVSNLKTPRADTDRPKVKG